MVRGRDESKNSKRNPVIVRNVNTPNVLWVNFANPSEPHDSVKEYIMEQSRTQSRSAHPSSLPKTPKDTE